MGRTGARFARSDRVKAITKERIAAGICTKCGKNKPDEGKKMCRVCLDKRIEERRDASCIKTTNNIPQNKNTESFHPVGSSDKPNRDTNGITGSGDSSSVQSTNKSKTKGKHLNSN